jgi:subtilisin family serine protease
VGATTSTDAKASYSNFGTCLDIFAPGSSITSASHSSTTGSKALSGTSMASPHVAGVAALHLQSSPAATPQQVRDALVNNSTPSKVTSAGTGSPNRLLFSAY